MGEAALYLGRQYRIEVVETGLTKIQFASAFFFLPALPAPEERRPCGNGIGGRAEEKIIPRAKHHARKLGVSPAEIKIVDAPLPLGFLHPPHEQRQL